MSFSFRKFSACSFFVILGMAQALLVHAAKSQSHDIVAFGGMLAGTLLLPTTGGPPYDTVLILPGSGPVDRDGNNPGADSPATYRLLAEGLAKRGIASVRIDKRGLAGSLAAGDGNNVTLQRYADDVESWIDTIADIPELSGDVWLSGHSEGALIAMVAAERGLTGVRGLVLLTAPGRRLGIVLREQLADNPANAPIIAEAFAAIETLERSGRVDPETLHPGLRGLFSTSVQGYLSEIIRFDPAEALQALGERNNSLPVLIVHGGRDIQISGEDARALVNARPDAKLVILADMNHVLKSVASDDRQANIATYSEIDIPIVHDVVNVLVEFIDETRVPR